MSYDVTEAIDRTSSLAVDKTITLRAAHVSEAKEISLLSRQHVEYGLRWRWTPTRIRSCIRDAETMVLVASRSGVIEGFAIMKFGDNIAHLLLLAVQPQARRSGIGSSLVRWLEKSCITAGILHVRLEMRAANHAAKLFYQHLGYRRLGQVAAYYDQREAAIVMGRMLNERVSG